MPGAGLLYLAAESQLALVVRTVLALRSVTTSPLHRMYTNRLNRFNAELFSFREQMERDPRLLLGLVYKKIKRGKRRDLALPRRTSGEMYRFYVG